MAEPEKTDILGGCVSIFEDMVDFEMNREHDLEYLDPTSSSYSYFPACPQTWPGQAEVNTTNSTSKQDSEELFDSIMFADNAMYDSTDLNNPNLHDLQTHAQFDQVFPSSRLSNIQWTPNYGTIQPQCIPDHPLQDGTLFQTQLQCIGGVGIPYIGSGLITSTGTAPDNNPPFQNLQWRPSEYPPHSVTSQVGTQILQITGNSTIQPAQPLSSTFPSRPPSYPPLRPVPTKPGEQINIVRQKMVVHPRAAQIIGIKERKGAKPRGIVRRLLSEGEKRLVKEMRQMHACALCRINKLKCSPGICMRCLAMSGRPELAKHICIRGGLYVFCEQIEDPFATDLRRKRLPPPTSPSGKRPKLVLGTWIIIDGKRKVCFPSNPLLEIGTQECENMEVYLQPNIGLDFKGISPYLVDPNTLPSTTQLDEWTRQLIPLYFNLAPHLTNFIDEFLLRFLAINPSLPIQRFADLTLRIVSLGTWITYSHPATTSESLRESTTESSSDQFSIFDCDEFRMGYRLSCPARDQIIAIAAEGIKESERQLLLEFDMIMRTYGPNPQDMVVIGLCLRRLGMIYWKNLRRYRSYSHSSFIQRIEKSKAMYEALTTGYSMVYRGTTSPYSPEWRLEEHYQAFHNDENLAMIFLKILQEERKKYQKYRDYEDFEIEKRLFWERNERKGPRTRRREN